MDNSDRLVARRQFVVIDSLLVGFALIAALCSSDHLKLPLHFSAILTARLTIPNLIRAAAVFYVWTLLMRFFRTYTAESITAFAEAFRIAAAVAATALVLDVSFDSTHKGASSLHIAADFCLFCLLTMCGVRAIVAFLTHHTGPALLGSRKVVIAGTGPRAIRAFRYVRTKLHRSHTVLGFVDCRANSLSPGEIESKFLGRISNLESILVSHVVDEVIIAMPARSCYDSIKETAEICSRVGVHVLYPNDLFPTSIKSADPGMLVLRATAHDERLVLKRLIDILGAAFALIFLSPLMLIVAALVKLTSPGPVFFRQERYGLGRRRFRIFKFRTMAADAEARQQELESLNEAEGPIFKIRHDPRITKIGFFLRRTSLDELPQFLNVLVGHMSLVGPRPMSLRDVSLFNESWLMRRFSVKPGITGLWQVNGRSSTSFSRWIELDLQYIDNWSLGLDAKILALTIPTVVRGSGAM